MHNFSYLYHLAHSTFIEGVRNKVLWVIVAISILLTLVNISVSSLFSFDLGKVSIEFTLSAIALCGLLIVFFLALKIFTDDFERK